MKTVRPKMDTPRCYVTVKDAATKKSANMTLDDATPSEVIAVLKAAANGSARSRRRAG
jgi:hypothetical protein